MDDEPAQPSEEAVDKLTHACIEALHAAADLGRQDLYGFMLAILNRVEEEVLGA